MKVAKKILAAAAVAMMFAACVTSPESEKQSEKKEEIAPEIPPKEKEVEEEQKPAVESVEEKTEETPAREDWTNGEWRVTGENGAQRIENAERIAVDGRDDLAAAISVASEKRLTISLLGYAEKKGVNTWSTSFSVSVQDNFGIEFILNEAMRDGTVRLNDDNSALVCDLLNAGGRLVFLLTNEENTDERYSFAVENAEGTFADALAELKSRNISD